MKVQFEILFIRENKWIGHYAESRPEYHDIGGKNTAYGRYHYFGLFPCIMIKWFKKQ